MNNDLLHEIIKQLHEELARIDHAILRVEALIEGRSLRGRPPKALSEARAELQGEPSRVSRRSSSRKRAGSGDNGR